MRLETGGQPGHCTPGWPKAQSPPKRLPVGVSSRAQALRCEQTLRLGANITQVACRVLGWGLAQHTPRWKPSPSRTAGAAHQNSLQPLESLSDLYPSPIGEVLCQSPFQGPSCQDTPHLRVFSGVAGKKDTSPHLELTHRDPEGVGTATGQP